MPSTSLRSLPILAFLASAPLCAQLPLANTLSRVSRSGYTVQGVGARAMGLGNAFTAVADDATAVSFNPAGLAQLILPEATLVGYGSRRTTAYEGFRTEYQGTPLGFRDEGTTRTTLQPMFFALTQPFRVWGKNAVVQVSQQRLFDMDLSLERSPALLAPDGHTAFQGHLQVRQRGQIDVRSVALAFDLTPRILLGASLNGWRGDWSFDGLQVSPQGASARLEQTNQLRGTSWSMGLIWRSEQVNIGLVHRSAFLADYRVGTRLQRDPAQPDDFQNPPTTIGLRWPGTQSLGVAWRPHPQWLFAADWSRTPWSECTFEAPGRPLDRANFFDLGNPTLTRDTSSRRVGGEYVFILDKDYLLPIRAGLFLEPQPDVDSTTRAQWVMRGWAVGLGVKRRNIAVDAAWTESRGRRTIGQDIYPSPDRSVISLGQELERERRAYLSVTVQLPADKVNGFLDWLLVGR